MNIISFSCSLLTIIEIYKCHSVKLKLIKINTYHVIYNYNNIHSFEQNINQWSKSILLGYFFGMKKLINASKINLEVNSELFHETFMKTKETERG